MARVRWFVDGMLNCVVHENGNGRNDDGGFLDSCA